MRISSFLAGGREGEPARKLVLILKMLLFLPGNTSSLSISTVKPPIEGYQKALDGFQRGNLALISTIIGLSYCSGGIWIKLVK